MTLPLFLTWQISVQNVYSKTDKDDPGINPAVSRTKKMPAPAK